VTTSYFTIQAQREVFEDAYPVKLFSGIDLIRFLTGIEADRCRTDQSRMAEGGNDGQSDCESMNSKTSVFSFPSDRLCSSARRCGRPEISTGWNMLCAEDSSNLNRRFSDTDTPRHAKSKAHSRQGCGRAIIVFFPDGKTRMAKRALQRIFISYARLDGRQLALRLHKDLTAAGFDTWLDTTNIGGGASWTAEIEREIDRAHVVVAVLTQGSYVSPICRGEQLRSLRRGKNISVWPSTSTIGRARVSGRTGC